MIAQASVDEEDELPEPPPVATITASKTSVALADPWIAGHVRLASGLRDFPISFSLPAELAGEWKVTSGDVFSATCAGVLTVTQRDYGFDLHRSDWIRLVADELGVAIRRGFRMPWSRKANVGEGEQWDIVVIGQGEWEVGVPILYRADSDYVFFPGPPRRSVMWSIERPLTSKLDRPAFLELLRTIKWLGPGWFEHPESA